MVTQYDSEDALVRAYAMHKHVRNLEAGGVFTDDPGKALAEGWTVVTDEDGDHRISRLDVELEVARREKRHHVTTAHAMPWFPTGAAAVLIKGRAAAPFGYVICG